jgi:hypothetical protein
MGGVLRNPIAERPVNFVDFDERDEDVLASQLQRTRKSVGDFVIKMLLLLRRAPLVEEDLDHYQIVAPLNVEVLSIENEVVAMVLADDLEAIVLGHACASRKSPVNDFSDRPAILWGFPHRQVYSHERQVAAELLSRQRIYPRF